MSGWDYHTNRAYLAAHGTEDADRAVIARIGGNIYRHDGSMLRARGYTVAETDEYVVSEVGHVVNNRKASRRAYLPESAFDWPIYRAALQQAPPWHHRGWRRPWPTDYFDG